VKGALFDEVVCILIPDYCQQRSEIVLQIRDLSLRQLLTLSQLVNDCPTGWSYNILIHEHQMPCNRMPLNLVDDITHGKQLVVDIPLILACL
jgi:hypothetical protein